MGGGLALVLAAARPDAVAACVPFYGLIPWPDASPDYSEMSAAVLGHYAQKDDYFTPEAVRALEAQLKELGKDVEIARLRRRRSRLLQRHEARGVRPRGLGDSLAPHDRVPARAAGLILELRSRVPR